MAEYVVAISTNPVRRTKWIDQLQPWRRCMQAQWETENTDRYNFVAISTNLVRRTEWIDQLQPWRCCMQAHWETENAEEKCPQLLQNVRNTFDSSILNEFYVS